MRVAVRSVIVALLALLVGAGSASAASDHVVITGGAVVPAGQTAGDFVVLDGTVRIAGRATGDVVSVSGPVRVSGRVDGDLIAVSDRAFLAPTARVGGDLRYGDERPVLARGATVGGKISDENWVDAANGWGWVSLFGWWLAVSVSTLIVGALLVLLAPAALYAAERAVRERLGATVAWGVGIAIGVPLLAVLALVTLVGIPFGIALLLAAIPVLLVAYAASASPAAGRAPREFALGARAGAHQLLAPRQPPAQRGGPPIPRPQGVELARRDQPRQRCAPPTCRSPLGPGGRRGSRGAPGRRAVPGCARFARAPGHLRAPPGP